MSRPSLLVVTSPDSPELKVLDALKGDVDIVGVGRSMADLSDVKWGSIDVVLNCGVGAKAGKRAEIEEMWPHLTNLKWMHSSSAGLEHLLFPALAESNVTLTNAKGVYSHSLAEYALTCCNWFAKDLPRMRAAQKRGEWEPYEVEELRGKILGVVGYGDIGKECARLAKAFRMEVYALKRNPQLSDAEKEEGIISRVFTTDQLTEMMPLCDYVIMATPFTEKTHKLFSAEAVAAMKESAVFVNVGRGKCVDEEALVSALQQGRIRGAGLDVFYQEPLPKESPLYQLDNVLMSAHCADRTKEFQFESLKLFVDLMQNYMKTGELYNIVDKSKGY